MRVGAIPYYFDKKNKLHMLFMIPSNPKFGGPMPQIAKGKVDPGENYEQTMIREIEEELGLVRDKFQDFYMVWDNSRSGDYFTDIIVYAIKIDKDVKLNKPCYETEKVIWMREDKIKNFRKEQMSLLSEVIKEIKNRDAII